MFSDVVRPVLIFLRPLFDLGLPFYDRFFVFWVGLVSGVFRYRPIRFRICFLIASVPDLNYSWLTASAVS